MGVDEESTNRKLVAGSSEKRSVREVLIAARDRIARPGGWTQGELARDRDGNPVAPRASTACQWCAMGALIAVADGDWIDAEWFLERFMDGNDVAFNDGRTHADILAAFDRAIAAQDGAL